MENTDTFNQTKESPHVNGPHIKYLKKSLALAVSIFIVIVLVVAAVANAFD